MRSHQQFRVTGEGGIEGTMFASSRFLDEDAHRLVRLKDGREFYVPKSLLQPQRDGTYHLPLALLELEKFGQAPAQEGAIREETGDQVVPEIEERLEVTRRTVDTGKVQIRKTVTASETVVDEPLFTETYEIDRIPLNRIVEETAGSRYEGETLILPIFEEVLVVEKRLILREEIRLTRKRTERRDPQTHTVRREHVEVDRQPGPSASIPS